MLQRLKKNILGLALIASISLQALHTEALTAELFEGVKTNNAELVRSAINKGACVKSTMDDEQLGIKEVSVLHYALNCDVALLQLLLDQGADVNAVDKTDFCTPLHTLMIGYASLVTGYWPEVLNFPGSIPLAEMPNTENGVEAVKYEICTLHNHALTVLRLLLKNGADLTIKTQGFTALDMAKMSDAKAIITLMEESQKLG